MPDDYYRRVGAAPDDEPDDDDDEPDDDAGNFYTAPPSAITVVEIDQERQRVGLRKKALAWAMGYSSTNAYHAALQRRQRASVEKTEHAQRTLKHVEEHGELPERPADAGHWADGPIKSSHVNSIWVEDSSYESDE